MNLGPLDYSAAAPPAGYHCTTCGASGCKLWRRYQTCADYTDLACCDCAGKSQEMDVSGIDADGRVQFDPPSARRSDAIGWRVPAVPTEEGDTFWGYTSVPDAGVAWWRALPTRTIEVANV